MNRLPFQEGREIKNGPKAQPRKLIIRKEQEEQYKDKAGRGWTSCEVKGFQNRVVTSRVIRHKPTNVTL